MASANSLAKAVDAVAERVAQAFNEPHFHDHVKNLIATEASKSDSKPSARAARRSAPKARPNAPKADSGTSSESKV